MNIRHGEISEIEQFQLFSVDNQGDDVVVAEIDGTIVGYMQINEGVSDATIYFMESTVKGVGSALIDWLKSRCDYIVADNAIESAQGFYGKMGFTVASFSTGYSGQICMEWAND